MQNTNSVRPMATGKRLIWVIIFSTILMTVAITWFYQCKLRSIDREFEKVRTYETK